MKTRDEAIEVLQQAGWTLEDIALIFKETPMSSSALPTDVSTPERAYFWTQQRIEEQKT